VSSSTPIAQRLNVFEAVPAAIKPLFAVEQYARSSGLEHSLLALVKLRASYINGCAFCVDMHTKDARLAGETEQRLFGVPVWRETPYYTPRERAALAWTEAVTRLGEHGVSDELYRETREYFSEQELVNLTIAVIAINNWNRLSIAFKAVPGSYQPPKAL
jgi:AhpD family alkylhydroperoxidase